jgi:trans-aconitate methyltransferase
MKWNTQLYDQSHDFVSGFGAGILSWLDPKPGQNILDLGCGTGDLTRDIFDSGATVLGVDGSEEMIQAARIKFPEIPFRTMDARFLELDQTFDSVFSNAVLHWIPEKEAVIQGVRNVLKEGGVLVAEFGGKGNVGGMLDALQKVFIKKGYHRNAEIRFWYFPSIGEYASELEKQGFRVLRAEHFDRPTPLNGPDGMAEWFRMFGEGFFEGIPQNERDEIQMEVQKELKATHFKDGVWVADYKRIRVMAVKN